MRSNKPPFRHTALSERLQAQGLPVRKKIKQKLVVVRDRGMEVAMERRRMARGKTTSTSR